MSLPLAQSFTSNQGEDLRGAPAQGRDAITQSGTTGPSALQNSVLQLYTGVHMSPSCVVGSSAGRKNPNSALEEYQYQMHILDIQNKKRRAMSRQGQSSHKKREHAELEEAANLHHEFEDIGNSSQVIYPSNESPQTSVQSHNVVSSTKRPKPSDQVQRNSDVAQVTRHPTEVYYPRLKHPHTRLCYEPIQS